MEQQIAQYFLLAVIISFVSLMIIIAIVSWAFVQIKRDTDEIIRQVGNLGAMTQNVAAMTREILRRTEQ